MAKEKKPRCNHPNCNRQGIRTLEVDDSTTYWMCKPHVDLFNRVIRNYFIDWKVPKDQRASEDQSSDAASV